MGTRTRTFWAGAAIALGLLTAVAGCGPRPDATAPAAAPVLIARADLFGEAVRFGAQLSPRGDRVAFLAARDGVTNLWVLSVGAMDEARPLTDDRGRGVRSFAWGPDSATLIYALDPAGDGNTQLRAVSADGGEARDLTPAGARAEIAGVSLSDPDGVMITLNQRDAAWPDLMRVDLATGSRTLVQRNGASAATRFTRFVLDRENRLRLALRTQANGSVDVQSRSAEGAWSTLFTIPFEDVPLSSPIAFVAGGESFVMYDSAGRDRAVLMRVDARTGVKTVLGESARADVADVWLDPATNEPEAFAANYLRAEWRALEIDAQADLEFLDAQLTGDFRVTSRSADDSRWIVVEEGPAVATRTHVYDRADRANRRISLLFRHRPGLDAAPLQPMTPIEIEARDGLTLVSYLTLPIGADTNGDARPETPVPLVLLPHDGPWARDAFGFNTMHQWLANRGYAVLSVNFRGSTGFGEAFVTAGNREWGGRIQEDLQDALQWAIDNGVAQSDRVAIVGSGFGGYAAVAGLTFTPEQFRCAVAFGAPTNLSRLVEAATVSQRDTWYLRVGDTRTAEGRQALRGRSPAQRVGQIRRPLLIGVGALDRVGSRAEFDQVALSLRLRAVPLVSLVFPDEGGDFTRPQNRLAYAAIVEQFLGECLGGRIEPVGAAFDGANMIVFDGAASVPGLQAFQRRPAAAPAQPRTPVSADGVAVAPEMNDSLDDEPRPLAAPPPQN
ncbi:MAG: prolyl oligopeptidase family serine peptidase [Hyphomonadaceae bacterium]|nr:prolyl oligopeptidase family serine peptidase [Hyphomonadaceae bacterium]